MNPVVLFLKRDAGKDGGDRIAHTKEQDDRSLNGLNRVDVQAKIR